MINLFNIENYKVDTSKFTLESYHEIPSTYSSTVMKVLTNRAFVPKDVFYVYDNRTSPPTLVPAPLASQYITASYQDLTTQTPSTGTIPVNACVTFTIEDSYGDAICCSYGNGSYTVTDGLGNIVAQGGSFGSEEETVFETGNLTVGLNEINQTEYIDNRIYDVLGRELNEIPTGIMYIQNRKIYINYGN